MDDKQKEIAKIKKRIEDVGLVVEDLTKQLKHCKVSINERTGEVTSLKEKLKRLERSSVDSVTDHAILRWLEKVDGVNIQKAKEGILEALGSVYKQDTTSGKFDVIIGDKEYTLVVKDGLVFTMYPKEKRS
jgi:predicted  nucleic acid-binding Zn-ribbon protein